ncbi:sensor histidine kinase [Halonotius terrestris]|uniref:sensor histidine kinase n=1 Tax=Halonotius terrestris TaxID=2487750 RepID=UPI001FE4B1B3|nr:histidine kinase N-terminal 7TM domain-containing protein [Halonotius terrestris]
MASFGAAVGALYLLQYLYRKRDRSGAAWFMGNIAAVAVFCAAYGGALLVFDPTLRVALEAIAFSCVGFMGPFFLAFGLDYTGRGDLIRTPLFGIVAIVPIVTAGLAATNQVHHLLWTDLQFGSVFGLSTVLYTIQPWGIFALLFSIGTAAVGSLLLIGAILSYGPLYRREATAVILSTAPPSVGVFVWMFELGPIPELHLTAPFMLVHVALDGFAFVGTHMFETNPATQRMAERTGLDSLSDPVFVLDTNQQIVQVNNRTEAVFERTRSAALPIPLADILGVELATLRETQELTIESDGGTVFAVSYSELTDPSDTTVGSMLVLYDVTADRQREQQLSVLNRVLRHNLRNETTVIRGYAEAMAATVEGSELGSHAEKIDAASNRLLSIAEKARNFESIQEGKIAPKSTDIGTVLTDVEAECTDDSAASIESTVTPSELQLRTDPVVLSVLLTNLIENAIEHSTAETPSVTITVAEAEAGNGRVSFEIRDRNEPIPKQEIQTLQTGFETSLQHGQGIGMWIINWCVQKLNGEIEFDYDDGNVVTVTLPQLS